MLTVIAVLLGSAWLERGAGQDTLLVVFEAAAEFSLEQNNLKALGTGLVFDTSHHSAQSFAPELKAGAAALAIRNGVRLGARDELIECREMTPESFRRRCRLTQGTRVILQLGHPRFSPEGEWLVQQFITRFYENAERGEHYLVFTVVDVILRRLNDGGWSIRFGDHVTTGHSW